MTNPTHEEYQISSSVTLLDAPFYSILCALFRRADSDNLALLQDTFPRAWHTFKQRVNAPGGLLPGEQGTVEGGLLYKRDSKPPYELKTVRNGDYD